MEKRPRDSEEDSEYEEVVEEVTTTHSIILRFPCFDFFQNVSLCEKTEGDRTVLYPEGIEFDLPSLKSSRPVVHLRTGKGERKSFLGHWENTAPQGYSNTAVVGLSWTGNTDDEGRDPDTVRSLFAHAEGGLSSDAARRVKERLFHQRAWQYQRIEIPTAALVLEPL